MTIYFQKEHPGKPHTLRCERPDGSVIWQSGDEYHIFHDLIHYAIETTIGTNDGFYGFLSKGGHFEDFEKPKGEKPVLTLPLALPEALVAVVQMEIYQGYELSETEFNQVLADNLSTMDLITEPVEMEQILALRAAARSVLQRWRALGGGGDGAGVLSKDHQAISRTTTLATYTR